MEKGHDSINFFTNTSHKRMEIRSCGDQCADVVLSGGGRAEGHLQETGAANQAMFKQRGQPS